MVPVTRPPTHPISPERLFSLFPEMKKVLKGKDFAHVEEMKRKTSEALKGIKIDNFKHCFEQRKSISMGGCTASDGEDFEAD